MRRLMLTVLLALLPTAVAAQLVQPADLVHEGTYVLPFGQDIGGQDCFDYIAGGLGYNPANDSLFVVGHVWNIDIGEVGIPTSYGDTMPSLQGCADAVSSAEIDQINPGDPNSKVLSGMAVSGSTLIANAYSYYDGGGNAVASTFTRSTTLSSGRPAGPFRIGSGLNPAFYAGAITPIPSEWQAVLGGDTLVGQCCLSIIGRTSRGPAAFATSLSGLASGTDTAAQELVWYDGAHETLGALTSALNLSGGPYFNGTVSLAGSVIIPGTDTMLSFLFGGFGSVCYKCGGANPGGYSADGPYTAYVLAYDVRDLQAVADGAADPWSVVPYDAWTLPSLGQIRGLAYDSTNGRIFLSTHRPVSGSRANIHVFTVAGSAPTPAPPVDTDTDDDGVEDASDLCPGTTAGVTVDANGCEVIEPDPTPTPDLDGRVSALEATVDGLQTVDNATAAQLADLQTQIDGLQAQIDALPGQTDTTALQAQLDALQARIDAFAITVSIP